MKIKMNENFTTFKKSAGLFIKTGIISICNRVQGRKSMGVVHTACFRRCNRIYVCKV